MGELTLSLNCFSRSQINIRKLKTDRNDPVGFVYFENTSFIFKAMRWRSSSVKLEPEGKHKPSSNNFRIPLFHNTVHWQK